MYNSKTVKILLAALLAGTGWAQPLTVYSDLAEIDATGKVTAPETPREILSPALVRNGFTSFQVVVEAPADKKWWLFIGQNPANSVKVTMYRENGPRLESVEVPRQSSGTEVLWMDVWTDRKTPLARIKIEPELMIDDDWVIYPIEGRVMEAMAPDGPMFDLMNGTSFPVWKLAGQYACDLPATGTESGTGPFIARWRARNVEQDTRLATARSAKEEVRKLFGSCSSGPPSDPEWYLPIRDYLYRLR